MAIYSNVLFERNQGETWSGGFVLRDQYGRLVSLQGASSSLVVKTNATDADAAAIITLTRGAGIVFQDPGCLTFYVSTASLIRASFAVRWRVVLSNAFVQDLWDGTLVIK